MNIKKALLRAAAVTASAAMMMLSLAGCGDETIETVVGKWQSTDGYTLVLTDTTLSLTDNNGENCLPYDSLDYDWNNDRLYIDLEGSTYGIFETDLNEDTLKLTYIAETLGVSDSDVTTITLTRIDS